MRKIMVMALAGLAALGATTAQAQTGDRHDGYRPGGDHRAAADVCSGNRARGLESQLDARLRDHSIDPRFAGQMRRQVETYKRYQRVACDRHDWNAVQGFASRYDELQGRIEQNTRNDGGHRR